MKKVSSKPGKLKKLLLLAIFAVLLAGGWWFYKDHGYEHFSGIVQQYVDNGEFVTLKARYTAEQIMQAHSKELLVNEQHSFQEPSLKFHPYLLMEVKYSQPDKKSREASSLWSLMDGEMVINTDTWEKTHGFEDAINADATRSDFKLMQALAKTRGPVPLDRLQKDLQIEKETLKSWIDSALAKHLVVLKGNELQLHFQDPKILVAPETQMNDWLVKKPYNHTQRIAAKYSKSQIQKNAKAAFGEDFTVRNFTEVLLPIHVIQVVNPDGSIFTSYWNALTGQRLNPRYAL